MKRRCFGRVFGWVESIVICSFEFLVGFGDLYSGGWKGKVLEVAFFEDVVVVRSGFGGTARGG